MKDNKEPFSLFFSSLKDNKIFKQKPAKRLLQQELFKPNRSLEARGNYPEQVEVFFVYKDGYEAIFRGSNNKLFKTSLVLDEGTKGTSLKFYMGFLILLFVNKIY